MRYQHVVSTIPLDGAWVIGMRTEGSTMDPDEAEAIQKQFDVELQQKGWLP